MKARLLFEQRRLFKTDSGRTIRIEMDLYELEGEPIAAPYRFSWIAFDVENPAERVLFDSHPPKGPHFHLDDDETGISFEWIDIDQAVDLFETKTRDHFGALIEIPEDGGRE